MNVRLSDADARAVDLLLDRAAAARGNGAGQQEVLFAAGPTAAQNGGSNDRIHAVEKLLNLLHAMPASDPAQDLMQRTMERIDATTEAPLRGPSPTLIDVGRPMA